MHKGYNIGQQEYELAASLFQKRFMAHLVTFSYDQQAYIYKILDNPFIVNGNMYS
jgi:hypothetical protein